MTGHKPNKAMILAAGFGKRMQPITHTIPKPLVPVNGKTLLDRSLDRLSQAGIPSCVVNTHHLGQKIHTHLKSRTAPQILFSDESNILETGGGVKKALPLLGDAPFFVLNGDVLWTEGNVPALERLATLFDPGKMDILMLLHPRETAVGYAGRGDFFCDEEGRLSRVQPDGTAPYIYAGIHILSPHLFSGTPEGPFSLNDLFTKANKAGRLFGLPHDGGWYHVGTPDSIGMVEQCLFDCGAETPADHDG